MFLSMCRYGDASGDAVLRHTIRQSHVFTCLQELEAWPQCEAEVVKAGPTSLTHIPALILTRGREGALFSDLHEGPLLEMAWDRGLDTLNKKLSVGGEFDVCTAGVEDGGLRLPLYRPEAVATAIQLVMSCTGKHGREEGQLEKVVASLPTHADADAPQGVLRFNLIKSTVEKFSK